jgi:hypothetical protein
MKKTSRYLRLLFIFSMLISMTGCLHWIHAAQTYRQMSEFDRYFAVSAKEDFTVHFKEPKLFSEDFVALAKLQPSSETKTADGNKLWHYLFRKVDKDNKLVEPEISFYCDLTFGKEDRVNDWTFSKMFLQIAPAEFLEASFRSLGGAEINEEKKQLRAKAELAQKIAADLPKKAAVVKQLGEPLEIVEEEKLQIYRYMFKLDAKNIEEGYEDRAISEVKIMFDKNTTELVKMSGRFAGLKISINYRDFLEDDKKVADSH